MKKQETRNQQKCHAKQKVLDTGELQTESVNLVMKIAARNCRVAESFNQP